jgi:starch synthase
VSLKVLFVSAEVSPYSKSGGLGDVAGSLPKALREKGVDIRVVLPMYKTIPSYLTEGAKAVAAFPVKLSWRTQEAEIFELKKESVYFIKNNYYFYRDGYYGYADDYERFAFFSKAAVEMLGQIDFKADILHFNDWHTGLGATYLRSIYHKFSYYAKMRSLFTIHNLHYQGVFGRETLWEIGLNDGYFTNGELEFHNKISYLKAGIVHSHGVSTVSETYAKEIQTPCYGYGMDGLLYQRGAIDGELYGITNGIDTGENNPETDSDIFANFNACSLAGKREGKHRLQQELGLPVSDVPMVSMITRLAEQKGFDILSIIMEELLSLDIQLVILGTGERRYEDMLRHFAWKYPHKLSANIKFDATLARRIYAGADIFMMPSVYEPCGLGQLFSMRYGTIPVVRKTGGLADTVKHFDPAKGTGNGFLFEDYVASGLMWALREALHVYGTPGWETLIKNAMAGDYSWDTAAGKYVELYKKVLAK